jgi:signal-transduction protein with cAMP-binding, CBS, and nucleotidyltransferase domain
VPVIENGKILGLVSYTDIVLKGIPSQNSQPEIKEG